MNGVSWLPQVSVWSVLLTTWNFSRIFCSANECLSELEREQQAPIEEMSVRFRSITTSVGIRHRNYRRKMVFLFRRPVLTRLRSLPPRTGDLHLVSFELSHLLAMLRMWRYNRLSLSLSLFSAHSLYCRNFVSIVFYELLAAYRSVRGRCCTLGHCLEGVMQFGGDCWH